MADDAGSLESLRIICPVCREPYQAQLEETPQTVRCHFCDTPFTLPSVSQAIAHYLAARRPETRHIGEYSLQTAEPGHGWPKGRSAGDPNDDLSAAQQRRIVTVECPRCHERARVAASAIPGQIECASCHTPVAVPTWEQIEAWRVAPVTPRSKDELGEYSAAAPAPATPLRTHLFDRLAEIRSEPLPPPPHWTFFSSVFTFPWEQQVVLRWGFLTAGFAVVLILATTVVSTVGKAEGGLAIVALGFFALPLIWMLLLTVSYAAACALCIVESTAAGLGKVESWPDPYWKDWMFQFLHVAWVAALPAAAAYALAKLAAWQGLAFWPVLWGSLFVLFPIVLLSALEAGSLWAPMTPVVLKSLISLWWGWLVFYLLTVALAAVLAALVYFGFPRSDYGTALALSPLLAAAILIYARLLGRLAWRIGRQLSQ
ncbi:MAG: hypothetical protein ACT4QC_11270 [Planctomycetaceae bacterium]